MKRADMYKEERRKGLTYQAIADKYGVSKQAVAQVCGRDNGLHFREWNSSNCVYPNVRKWLNENRITTNEMMRRMGLETNSCSHKRLRHYLSGHFFPSKQKIDVFLSVTGLTYEQFFETETL